MIEGTVDQNRGAFVALACEVGKRLVSSDGLLGRRVRRIEQPTLVVFARQPLDQAVVVSGEGGQLSSQKRVHIVLPPWRRKGRHRLVLFRRALWRCSGLCVNRCSNGRAPIPFQTIHLGKPVYARIASFALLSNHRKVSRRPSPKGVFARQPNSASAREVSRQRRGWPSGLVASHRRAPSYPTTDRICSSNSRMLISSPKPRFTGSGFAYFSAASTKPSAASST